MENVYFTKIGTVKCNEFELTVSDFVDKMSRLIMSDNNEYSMYHTNGNYFMVYNGEKYKIKYGKDDLTSDCSNKEILDYVNQLAVLSDIQGKIQKRIAERNKEKQQEKIRLRQAVENNIMNTTKEMEAAIELIKCKVNPVTTDEYIKMMNYGELGEAFTATRFVLGFLGGLGLLIGGLITLCSGVAGPSLFWILSSITAADGLCLLVFTDDKISYGFRGLYMAALSIAIMPLAILIIAGTRLYEKIRMFFKIKKIKNKIEKHRNGKKSSKTIKNKNVDEINKLLNSSKVEISPIDITMSLKDFTELKEMISQIKDEKIRNKMGQILCKIIDSCLVSGKVPINKRKKIYDELLDQISELKITINKVLKEQKQYDDSEETHNRLMNEVNEKIEEVKNEDFVPQKSIGAR